MRPQNQNVQGKAQEVQTPRPQKNLAPTEQQLKQLQVKAELNKLGDAPRAYQEKLAAAESMDIDTVPASAGGKLSLNERFGKIQGGGPSIKKTLRLVQRPKVYKQRGNY